MPDMISCENCRHRKGLTCTLENPCNNFDHWEVREPTVAETVVAFVDDDCCVKPDWEGMYEQVSAENADLKLKLEDVTSALKKSYREVEILRGMIRVVESFNGEPILRYIKNKSENEVMVV